MIYHLRNYLCQFVLLILPSLFILILPLIIVNLVELCIRICNHCWLMILCLLSLM
nr:hypothetical protein HWPLAUVJ_HWPLAUVJ_CDS_0010 [Microvirus sp.]